MNDSLIQILDDLSTIAYRCNKTDVEDTEHKLGLLHERLTALIRGKAKEPPRTTSAQHTDQTS